MLSMMRKGLRRDCRNNRQKYSNTSRQRVASTHNTQAWNKKPQVTKTNQHKRKQQMHQPRWLNSMRGGGIFCCHSKVYRGYSDYPADCPAAAKGTPYWQAYPKTGDVRQLQGNSCPRCRWPVLCPPSLPYHRHQDSQTQVFANCDPVLAACRRLMERGRRRGQGQQPR